MDNNTRRARRWQELKSQPDVQKAIKAGVPVETAVKAAWAKSGPGRRCIFKKRSDGRRIQAVLSEVGEAAFETARTRLAVLAKRNVKLVSDADTVEFLARGESSTKAYLKSA